MSLLTTATPGFPLAHNLACFYFFFFFKLSLVFFITGLGTLACRASICLLGLGIRDTSHSRLRILHGHYVILQARTESVNYLHRTCSAHGATLSVTSIDNASGGNFLEPITAASRQKKRVNNFPFECQGTTPFFRRENKVSHGVPARSGSFRRSGSLRRSSMCPSRLRPIQVRPVMPKHLSGETRP